MSHFGDPDFVYHVAAAQLWGTMAMRLADADGLPLDYTDYANQIREYFDESTRLAKRRHLEAVIDEKSINETVKSFSEEATRVEKERQKLIAEADKSSSAAAKLHLLNDG